MKLNLVRNIKISGLATIIILTLFCDFIEAQTDEAIMHMHRATRRRTAVVVSSATHEKDEQAEQQQKATDTTKSSQTKTQSTTSTTPTTTPPPTTQSTSEALAIGTVVASLPAGCTTSSVNNVEYYHCGPNWYRTAFQGNTLVYVTTDPPK